MNKLLYIIVGIILFSCNHNEESKSDKTKDKTEINQEKESFDWLLGKWKRNNEEEGKETFENWNKVSNSHYTGIGFSMQNGDTIKQEKIDIIKSNGSWNLVVKSPQDKESVLFKIVEIRSNEFISTNDSLEFPNLIKYWKNGDKINALVAGDDFEIPFEFERLN